MSGDIKRRTGNKEDTDNSDDVKPEDVRQRVQKIIANAGVTSRRNAEVLIEHGRVTVNGRKIKLGDKADPSKDEICVDNGIIGKHRKTYIMFNKPADCLTTLFDPKGRKTIFSYIREKERLIPVGRLDFKTEGLLLLTNDGDFANRIMHPRYEITKTYIVNVDKPVSDDHIRQLIGGIVLEDGRTSPSDAKKISADGKTIIIKIHEGKNRVVRRMLNALGYYVVKLQRTAIGDLHLKDLQRGRYRKLVPNEIRMFKEK